MGFARHHGTRCTATKAYATAYTAPLAPSATHPVQRVHATRGAKAPIRPGTAPTHRTGTARHAYYITAMRVTLDLPLTVLAQAEALCNPAKRTEALRTTAEGMRAAYGAKVANDWLTAQARPRHRPLTPENILAEILSKVLANGDFSQ